MPRRTARVLDAAALLVTREPTVTTTMSTTSPIPVAAIAQRFHQRELGPSLGLDRLTAQPRWAELENRTRRLASDLANPLSAGQNSNTLSSLIYIEYSVEPSRDHPERSRGASGSSPRRRDAGDGRGGGQGPFGIILVLIF